MKSAWDRHQRDLQSCKTIPRLPGEIPVTSDMQMTPPLWQKVKRNSKASWWKWKRSLVGYAPQGHKELDTTEGLSTHKHRVMHVRAMSADVFILIGADDMEHEWGRRGQGNEPGEVSGGKLWRAPPRELGCHQNGPKDTDRALEGWEWSHGQDHISRFFYK